MKQSAKTKQVTADQAVGAELFKAVPEHHEDHGGHPVTGVRKQARTPALDHDLADFLEGISFRYVIAVNTVSGQIPNPGEIRDVDMMGETSRLLGNIQLKLVDKPEDYFAVCDPRQDGSPVWILHTLDLEKMAKAHPAVLVPLLDRADSDKRLPYIVHRMGDYKGIWQSYDAVIDED